MGRFFFDKIALVSKSAYSEMNTHVVHVKDLVVAGFCIFFLNADNKLMSSRHRDLQKAR